MEESTRNVEHFANETYDDVIEAKVREDISEGTDGERETLEQRPRRESDKELWLLPRSPAQATNADCGDVSIGANSQSKEQEENTNLPSEVDTPTPVKPPRRKEKGARGAKLPATVADRFSASDGSDDVVDRDIVCKPVLTSSPNQDELRVDSSADFDNQHHVLTFHDESSESGVRKVESFYDYLWSDQGLDSTTSSSVHNDNTYDEVPIENTASSASFGSANGTGIYDEVIVNRGT